MCSQLQYSYFRYCNTFLSIVIRWLLAALSPVKITLVSYSTASHRRLAKLYKEPLPRRSFERLTDALIVKGW